MGPRNWNATAQVTAMDELDGIDLVVAHRARIAKVLLGTAAAVADGRLRVTSRAISLLHKLLTEMSSPAVFDAGATEDPPPAVDSKPPLPPQ